MSRQRSLIGLAALLGLIATQACSSDAPAGSGPSTSAGSGGQLSSAGTSSTAGSTSTSQGGSGGSTQGASGSAGTSASAGAGGSTLGSSGGAAGALGSAGSGGAAADTFTLQTTAKGMVVATAKGITLYVYQPDTPAAGATPAVSACTSTGGSTCLMHWPLYYGNPVVVPAGLTASDFGSIDRGGGVMQSTYKGWPVYNYDDDKAPGDAKGDLEKDKNGKVIWYAVRIPFTAPPKP